MSVVSPQKVLVPFTEPFLSERAFDCAILAAQEGHGELILLHVNQPSYEQDQEELYAALRGLQNRARLSSVPTRVDTAVAQDTDYLLDYASKEGVSLIVLPEEETELDAHIHAAQLALRGCATRHCSA
jgi:hypothetical protein